MGSLKIVVRHQITTGTDLVCSSTRDTIDGWRSFSYLVATFSESIEDRRRYCYKNASDIVSDVPYPTLADERLFSILRLATCDASTLKADELC